MSRTRTLVGVVVAALGVSVALIGCPSNTSPPAPPPASGGAPGAAPAPPAAAPSGPAAAAGFGSIKGRVINKRSVKPPEPEKVTKDPEVCGETHDPGSLKLGSDGAVESCVVYVKGPQAPADWKKGGTYVVDQKTCHYTPRVIIVPVGESVTFTSQDDVLHNVKSGYQSFNEAVTKGSEHKLVCKEPTIAGLECNVHPFMKGLLVVAEHPWYVLTDATGGYKLEHVPAGTWHLFAHHEVLGKADKKGADVTVTADKETVVDIQFD